MSGMQLLVQFKAHFLPLSHSKHLHLSLNGGDWHCKTYPCSLVSIRSDSSKSKVSGNSATPNKPKRNQNLNLWSLDNETDSSQIKNKKKKKRRGKDEEGASGLYKSKSSVIVSAPMPVETEKVLQTQEPVMKPVWETFVSSISGYWKGVGAAFSPVTAEMEPISLGKRNEYLYDCYVLSKVEAVGSSSQGSNRRILRKTNWVVANPLGEQGQGKVTIQNYLINAHEKMAADNATAEKTVADSVKEQQPLPLYETTVLPSSDVMEEDFMELEPGLVFFEDGSYSRGPLMLDVGEPATESRYYISPTYKIEQCLVQGCHKRLRLVHTIAVKKGGDEVKLLRLTVYMEEWMGPSHLECTSETEEEPLTPLSQKKRNSPKDLVGSWKVFEISATAILDGLEEETPQSRPSLVYLCMETLKRRSLPEFPMHFADADALDAQDVSVLWLPGGITAYVDTKEDGVLTVGFGWYSNDGTNLLMERDYGTDGKLLEVRSKSEIKRRWSDDSM